MALTGRLTLTDPEGWAGLGGGNSSGQVVTDDSMLRLSTVWACARLVSETIGTLPLSVYERLGRDGRRVASEHPLHSILHTQPNADTTSSAHWEATVAAMLLRGNGRAEMLMVGERLVGLQFLDPRRLSPLTRNGAGQKIYRYTLPEGRQREIPHARVFSIPGFTLDGITGLSVIRYAADMLGAAQAADMVAGKTFQNGLMPTTYFKMEKVLTKAQREEFRENLEELRGALNAGTQPLLEAGMDVGNIGINPADAQLLETRRWSVEEICRWFRVPPWMVGHVGQGTKWGTGMEQEMIAFLTFTLMPWLRRIEQAINMRLFRPGDRTRYYAEFSIEGFLRADSAARASFYQSMVNNGVMTRDEVRVKENLPTRGGNADMLTVQSAMTTLDSLGKPQDSDRARAALRAWLDAGDSKPSE